MTTRPKMADVLDVNQDDRIKKIFESSLLSPNEKVPKPEPVFGVSDPIHGMVHVGTKGNISLFKGSKKARKTFAISAIAAAVAGNQNIIQFKSMLGKKGLVLYVDTEQGKYDCKKVLHREMRMSGIDVDHLKNHLMFLTLRPHAPNVRKDVIEYAIRYYGDKLDLVIIDGIRDLMVDINDSGESTNIVTNLMAWSDDYNVHILSILHENKSNSSSRGHIGTELENKSESIIRIVKAENDDSYSAVEAENMRGHSFDPYLFTIDDDGLPILADESVKYEDVNTTDKKKSPKPGPKAFDFDDADVAEHAEMIRKCFVNEQGMFDDVNPLSARKFQSRIKASFMHNKKKISDHKSREFTDKYLKLGMLKDLNEGEENSVKKLVPGIDDELPF